MYFFSFFSFFVNRDSDETLTARKREREREKKTEKQGAAEETNKRWTLSLSFGISCQDWWHSQPPPTPFKLRSENGAKRKGGQNMTTSLPNTLGADSMCFCVEGGQGRVCVCGWVKARHSVVKSVWS